jgi:hypothetical protein
MYPHSNIPTTKRIYSEKLEPDDDFRKVVAGKSHMEWIKSERHMERGGTFERAGTKAARSPPPLPVGLRLTAG